MNVYENYLHDLGLEIRNCSIQAAKNAKELRQSEFDLGYMSAFHRVVSLMQQQADSLQIPYEKLGLNSFDPEIELI